LYIQTERERELRDRERRIKEEQERIEHERRSHEEQQRWIREEAARVSRIKEEAVRLQKEREDTERRERERREKERREEELRLKREQRDRERQERDREREQKREREEMEKRMQSGSGRLGKRPYQQQQQDNNSFESKRPAYSSPNSYSAMSNNNSSIFNRLEPHKANRSGPSQPEVSGGNVPTAPMIQPQDLPHVNPEIINAASQALANIRKTVPSVPTHMSSGRGGSSTLQAQIQQLAAATALASASNRPNMGLEFRGASNSASQSYSSDMMRPSMSGRSQGGVGRGMGMMSKSPHLGSSGSSMSGGGGMGKLPPEDQRYNRRLGGGSRSGGGMGGPGGYRSHGRQGRGY